MTVTLEREEPTPWTSRSRSRRGDRAGRRGVPLRHVRGHARQAVRQAGAGLGHRGPDGGRGGLRRIRRRAHGPDALVARHPGHARSRLVHAGAVAARPRHHPMRPACPGRAVAVRAPGHPAPPDRSALADLGLRPQGRRRGGVLPGAAVATRAVSRSPTRMDQARRRVTTPGRSPACTTTSPRCRAT